MPVKVVLFILTATLASWIVLAEPSLAQSQSLQQDIAQARQQLQQNQQRLAHYYWQMTQTVSIKGEVKQTTVYRVQLGADGKPAKTVVSQSSSGGRQRQFGIRHRIEEHYQQYAQSVGSLAQNYAQLNPNVVKQLYAQGRVSLRPTGSGYAQIVMSGYFKPNDSVVLTVRTSPTKALVGYNVSSYLSDPSDVVTIQAHFGRLSDGTRYVSSVTVNGQSMNLTISQQSSNFELL
jgi:uncharacterized membrane-anchored protein YhcB (DUF1043 family)